MFPAQARIKSLTNFWCDALHGAALFVIEYALAKKLWMSWGIKPAP